MIEGVKDSLKELLGMKKEPNNNEWENIIHRTYLKQ